MNDNQLLQLIVNELKEVTKELKDQGKTLSAQAVVLADHTRRSIANEENVTLLRQKMDLELEPVKKHINSVDTLFKVSGCIAGLALFVLTVIKIFQALGL